MLITCCITPQIDYKEHSIAFLENPYLLHINILSQFSITEFPDVLQRHMCGRLVYPQRCELCQPTSHKNILYDNQTV